MSGASPVDFAWQVHVVQEQWAARADAKAAVVFTVEGAVIAAVVAALGNPALAGSLGSGAAVAVWLGVGASLVAVVAALLVVLPRLRSHAPTDPAPAGLIYFGDVRSSDPAEVAARLAALSDDDQLGQLAVQLTRVADGNWRRYRSLRVAVLAALAGALLLVVGFVVPALVG